MTRIFKIPDAVFTDTSLPKVLTDPLLTNGSLALYEPGHPSYPWPSGVPADGFQMPNLAWERAVNLGVGANEAAVEGKFRRSSNNTSTIFIAERSGKGGIHGITTQSADSPASTPFGMAALFSDSLIAYLAANPTHHYFWSVWGRVTRGHKTANPGNMDAFVSISRFTTGLIGAVVLTPNGASQSVPAGGNRDGDRNLGTSSNDNLGVGNFIQNVAGVPNDTGGFTNSNYPLADASSSGTLGSPGRQAAQWGQMQWAANTSLQNNTKSWIWYRTYVEDLTVSGRTYAAVDALDNAEYAAQVTSAPVSGVGGRYFGDTYTNPTTLA